jgi:hypothetical protein
MLSNRSTEKRSLIFSVSSCVTQCWNDLGLTVSVSRYTVSQGGQKFEDYRENCYVPSLGPDIPAQNSGPVCCAEQIDIWHYVQPKLVGAALIST